VGRERKKGLRQRSLLEYNEEEEDEPVIDREGNRFETCSLPERPEVRTQGDSGILERME
jgi:hypothetical protein